MPDDQGTPIGADVGAGVDIQLGQWDILAKLQLGIDNMAAEAKRANDARQRRLAMVPGDALLVAAGVSNSSGADLYLPVNQKPALGRIWQVRRIVVGGSTATAAPEGTAYVLRSPGDPQDLSLAKVVDWTSNPLPQQAFYGTHQFVVLPSDSLWVYVTGCSDSTQYVAVFEVEDIDQGAIIGAVVDE